jgi:hypothetical protein
MFKIISLGMKAARTARKLSFKGSRPFRIYHLRTRLRLVRVRRGRWGAAMRGPTFPSQYSRG